MYFSSLVTNKLMLLIKSVLRSLCVNRESLRSELLCFKQISTITIIFFLLSLTTKGLIKYFRDFLVCNSDLETTGRVLDLHLSIWLCQIVSHTWLNRVSIVICYDRLSTTFCLRGLYIFESVY